MIGCFGSLVFESNDERLHTFTEFTRSISSNVVEHNRIGKKPRLEFVNANLDEITFTITLNHMYCSNNRSTMKKWETFVKEGIAETLVIGSEVIGEGKWLPTSISEAWQKIWDNGKLLSCNLDITLKEYVED